MTTEIDRLSVWRPAQEMSDHARVAELPLVAAIGVHYPYFHSAAPIGLKRDLLAIWREEWVDINSPDRE
jgi:hypothetical protein